MSNPDTLALKIAQLINAERPTVDLSSIQLSLDLINARLDKLETSESQPSRSFTSPRSSHPSLDKVAIAEAIVDQIFDGESKEKACTFEPNGKPCDHCSMCNSRGF